VAHVLHRRTGFTSPEHALGADAASQAGSARNDPCARGRDDGVLGNHLRLLQPIDPIVAAQPADYKLDVSTKHPQSRAAEHFPGEYVRDMLSIIVYIFVLFRRLQWRR
jgi:hypothetical protein